jgi:CheY-like chemotaxis protein
LPITHLVDAGFPVVEAHSGEEAAALLDALGPRKVGLAVSDIRMPGMSGVELAALMMDQWPTVPVLLLSGQGGPPTGDPGPFLPNPFARLVRGGCPDAAAGRRPVTPAPLGPRFFLPEAPRTEAAG